MINREVPVIVVNGILEAGKTHFINEALSEELFIDATAHGLILQCEEGEEEYDKSILANTHTVVETLDSKEEFDSKLESLIIKHDPDVVYIEQNIMWGALELPSYMAVAQTLTIIDATSFKVYFNNMRQKFVDMLTPSNVVIMYNCEDEKETSTYKRNLRLINRDLEFLCFDPNGNQMNLADDLPYSVETDHIIIEDEHYGIWFIDTMDAPQRYNQKKVTFTAQVMHHNRLPKGFILAGRKCMTCCADDIQDFYCICDNTLAKANLKNGSWVSIYGTILYKMSPEGEPMPYIQIGYVKPVAKPEPEVIGLS